MRIRLTDIRNHSVLELDLLPESCDMSGWQSGVVGWSIGQKGSDSPIELDETLGECHVGIFSASFHRLLWGVAKVLPEVWLFPPDKPPNNLVPFEPARWLLADREDLRRVAMGGDVRLRIDLSPIRFGNYIIECLKPAEVSKEICANCKAPLRMYFRVGSQQVCPECTEKFKEETRADLARCYRRALRDGVVAAIAGVVIHGILLATTHVSFGSVFIGALVGIAIRFASGESAGIRFRLTAVTLTLVAGSLPWWRGGQGTAIAAVYLAVGMFVAWMLTARNVPTEIHGPFQTKRT